MTDTLSERVKIATPNRLSRTGGRPKDIRIATGLGLLLALARWVPGLQALLAWESRRTEHLADQATVAAGLGWQLLEALETLAFAESVPLPDGLLGVLCRRGSPLTARADRVWRALSRV